MTIRQSIFLFLRSAISGIRLPFRNSRRLIWLLNGIRNECLIIERERERERDRKGERIGGEKERESPLLSATSLLFFFDFLCLRLCSS